MSPCRFSPHLSPPIRVAVSHSNPKPKTSNLEDLSLSRDAINGESDGLLLPRLPNEAGHGGQASPTDAGQEQNPCADPDHGGADPAGGERETGVGDPATEAENHRSYRARGLSLEKEKGVRGCD